MSPLTEETQDLIRLALASHKHCVHEDSQLCLTMTLLEVEVRREEAFTEEEIEDAQDFIADAVLESLILKGLVEATGIDQKGDFMVGFTEAGEEAVEFYGLGANREQD